MVTTQLNIGEYAMTTGMRHIKNSFLRTFGQSQVLHIPVDDDLVAMLGELAHEKGISIEKMGAKLLTQVVGEYYQATNEYVQRWEALSTRQQEVAALACLGYSNAEIAEKLHISLQTVKTHMGETLRKFDVKGRHQLSWMLRKWDFSPFDDQPAD